jgi:hypothetical protein
MSYVAFENTSNAMDQVAGMLEEALQANEPLDLNRHEQRPYSEMWEKCRALMELLEQHQQLVEDKPAEDEDEDEDEDPEESGPDHGKLWSDTSAELA